MLSVPININKNLYQYLLNKNLNEIEAICVKYVDGFLTHKTILLKGQHATNVENHDNSFRFTLILIC